MVVTVALRRRRLVCPHCAKGPVALRRLAGALPLAPSRYGDLAARAADQPAGCAARPGLVVKAVPFARPGANLSRDFDDMLAWLATRMDRSAVARLCRCRGAPWAGPASGWWPPNSDPDCLDGLFRIGVDEISWRNYHKYLTPPWSITTGAS